MLEDVVRSQLGTLGQVFFVTNDAEKQAQLTQRFDGVFSTIVGALAVCVADRGDVVLVDHEYTETRTTALTISVAGTSVIGLKRGNQRPELTGNAAIDCVNITGADVLFQGFAFPAPETDDQTADINVSGANVTIRDCHSIGSQTSKNKTDIITVASGANDLIVEHCTAYNTVVDCVSWLSLEAAVARPTIRNNTVMGQFSTAVLMDEATATLALVQSNTFKNTKATTAVVTFTTGNTTGVMRDNYCSGRHATIASNIVPGTGMDFFQNLVVEEAALNGILIPAADAD